MPTFPLATLACTVDDTGISAPAVEDVLTSLQTSYANIFGQDTYLGSDSQDGQWLGILTQIINDGNQADIAVFNDYSPTTAFGSGLSSVVKINGLQRDVATNSTCPITLVGQSGVVVDSGVVGDNLNLGTTWALPGGLIIPPGGQITATATCQQQGAVNAGPNSLTVILTPVLGWQTATNGLSTATPGAPVETDAALRQRQSISTSLPAQTPLESVVAQVENVSGVQRVRPYQNDQTTTVVIDSFANTLSGHSIALVVQGGSAVAVATAIALKKTPGTTTQGTTTETIFDSNGVPNIINFYVVTLVQIDVVINITPLANFVITTTALIQAAIVQFLNSLNIGEADYLNRLYGPAQLYGDAATTATGFTQTQLDALSNTYTIPVGGITQARGAAPQLVQDLPMAFYEAAEGIVANITVNVL